MKRQIGAAPEVEPQASSSKLIVLSSKLIVLSTKLIVLSSNFSNQVASQSVTCSQFV